MKVGFICLHYGKDYLGYAIKAVYDLLDEIFIAYSPVPSHGHESSMSCPDSRDQLKNAAFMFGDPQNKIKWYEGTWGREGDHRDEVFKRYPNASLICVIDSDEIWDPNVFSNITDHCLKHTARNFKQRLVTPWRSFNWLCKDEMMPDRFYKPKQQGTLYVPSELGVYYHMGYAIREELMNYKLSCHGHKNELKNDWFNNVFMKWPERKEDLHPTCDNIWHAKPFDKNELPNVLRDHPYWNLEVIR